MTNIRNVAKRAVMGVFLGALISAGLSPIGFAGYQVYRDWQSLQQSPKDADRKLAFDASLEVFRATISGIGTLATIAGGVVLYLNFRVATRNAQIAADNLKVSEEKQVTERFAKAIEHLGNSDVHIRLGGIYALERIARDSAKDHWTIMEILSAYVRERSPLKSPKATGANGKQSLVESYLASGEAAASVDEGADKIAIAIQAALTVIGRRKVEQDKGRIDLSDTNLVGANLIDAQLERVNLFGANLRDAKLKGANLWGADLEGANLTGANLTGANLKDANLIGAKLELTDLRGAKLSVVILMDANLDDADLRGALLNGANLHFANLRGADFTGADLNGADLSFAKLTNANLRGANLENTDLRSAKLTNAKLEGAKLEGADLTLANLLSADLIGAIGWTNEQLSQAQLFNTKLPKGSQLDPNRDRAKFGIPFPKSPSSPPPDASNRPSSGDRPTPDSPAPDTPDAVDGNPT